MKILIVLGLGLAGAIGAAAEPPAPDAMEPPKQLRITRGRAPQAHPLGRHIYLGKTVPDVGGIPRATYLTVEQYAFAEGKPAAGNVIDTFGLRYPHVGKGDVFPVFGALYRAAEVAEDAVTLDRLEPNQPAGVVTHPRTFPALVQRNPKASAWDNQCLLHGRAVLLKSIIEVPGTRPKGHAATFSVWLGNKHIGGKAYTGNYQSEATVVVGDHLVLREKWRGDTPRAESEYGHEVVAIVPPDDTRGVVGWVEFGEEKRSVASLAADRKRIVRPSPPRTPPPAEDVRPAETITITPTPDDWEGYGIGQPESSGFGRHRSLVRGPKQSVSGLAVEPLDLDPDRRDAMLMPRLVYPEPTRGQIIPLYGFLYKVDAIEGAAVTVRRLSAKDIPAGVSIRPRTFALTDSGALRSRRLALQSVTPGAIPTARIRVFADPADPTTTYEATVRVGDHLMLKEQDVDYTRLSEKSYGHKVLSIIERDRAPGVVGWVELDPIGVPEADLAKAKLPVVRPVAANGPPE